MKTIYLFGLFLKQMQGNIFFARLVFYLASSMPKYFFTYLQIFTKKHISLSLLTHLFALFFAHMCNAQVHKTAHPFSPAPIFNFKNWRQNC